MSRKQMVDWLLYYSTISLNELTQLTDSEIEGIFQAEIGYIEGDE